MTAKTALVTGGSRGIGRACVLRLARDGFDVALNYLSASDEAEMVAATVRSEGRRAMVIQADVSDPEQVAAMYAAVNRAFGRLDVLVTNAGISAVKPVLDLTAEDWDRVMAVNLKGTFLSAQGAIPIMQRHESGQMIFMASQAGLTGGVFVGLHYAASKAGVICVAKSLAKQLAPGIRVNCVAPGIVETDMAVSFPKGDLNRLVGSVPLGRIGLPEDVAAAVGFLASPGAAYMTGATLHVNGGIFMP